MKKFNVYSIIFLDLDKVLQYRFKKIMNYLAKHGKFDPIDFCKKYVVKKQKKGLTGRRTCGRVDYDRYD